MAKREEAHGETVWFVDLGTLEDLLALQAEVGAGLIVNDGGGMNIIIYDDRVE